LPAVPLPLSALRKMAGLVQLLSLDPCPAKAAQCPCAVVSIPSLILDLCVTIPTPATDLTGLEFCLALSHEAPQPCEPPRNQIKVE
jgi:hypothetical protein